MKSHHSFPLLLLTVCIFKYLRSDLKKYEDKLAAEIFRDLFLVVVEHIIDLPCIDPSRKEFEKHPHYSTTQTFQIDFPFFRWVIVIKQGFKLLPSHSVLFIEAVRSLAVQLHSHAEF